METDDILEPSEPRTAQKLYLEQKATECAEKTVQSHRYRTDCFMRWCDESDIDTLNGLTGRDVQKYRLWRQEQGDLAQITLNQNLSTIRVFLKWCGSIEAVPTRLHEKVMVPRVRPANQRRDETLDADAAQAIIEHVQLFHYASREHALFALFWQSGLRIGAANSLDVGDFDVDDERIDIVHRPDQDTQLKNGANGERPIAISTALATMLDDYVDHIRHPQTDEYGREPLFTTKQGRMPRATIRRILYRATAPCFRSEPWPDCSGSTSYDGKCGEAVSPHAIRRGSITHFLSQDVPVDIVGQRMDVSRDVVDKHYDKRSEEVKLEQRRKYLDNI